MSVVVNPAVAGGGGSGGGGDFAAQAVQNDNAEVSITSTAGDSSNYVSNYLFSSTSDNTTSSTSMETFSTSNLAGDGAAYTATNSLSDGEASTSLAVGAGLGSNNGSVSYSQTSNAASAITQLSLVANFGGDQQTVNIAQIANGSNEFYLEMNGVDEFFLVAPADTGVATATFSATNAPAAISPTNWIAVTLNGVVGYIPFFSA